MIITILTRDDINLVLTVDKEDVDGKDWVGSGCRSGSLDSFDPAENVASLIMPFYPNGKHIIIKHAAHCDSSQYDAIATLAAGFFTGRQVDEDIIKPEAVDFNWLRF